MIRYARSGIPLYFFSLFWAPSSVGKSLEKCMLDFLWEGVGNI